jgi:hypothetical protein
VRSNEAILTRSSAVLAILKRELSGLSVGKLENKKVSPEMKKSD